MNKKHTLNLFACALISFASLSAMNSESNYHLQDKSEKEHALISAVMEGHTTIVQQLVEDIVGVDIKDSEGKTILGGAAMQGHEEIVDILLTRGANPNIQDNNNNTPLMYATAMCTPGTIDRLVNQGFKWLSSKAPESHKKIIIKLLSQGANPTLQNNNGKSAYDIAPSHIKKILHAYISDISKALSPDELEAKSNEN